jgi:hypothetical protein
MQHPGTEAEGITPARSSRDPTPVYHIFPAGILAPPDFIWTDGNISLFIAMQAENATLVERESHIGDRAMGRSAQFVQKELRMGREQSRSLPNAGLLIGGVALFGTAFMSSRIDHIVFYILALAGVAFTGTIIWSISGRMRKDLLVAHAGKQSDRPAQVSRHTS